MNNINGGLKTNNLYINNPDKIEIIKVSKWKEKEIKSEK